MLKKDRFLSFLIVILMLIAAAITVNKTVFGYDICKPESQVVTDTGAAIASDTITIEPEGTTIVHTSMLSGTIDGYAGPVPLDIYISDGKIAEIKTLENAETPSFFNRASELLTGWTGKTPGEALNMHPDAVSGATYSSEAIISNVNAGLSYYQGVQSQSSSHTPWKIWIALGVTLAACIVPIFVRNKIYHNVQLIANVLVLGFWCGQFLDYAMILKYISGGFLLPTGLVAIVMLVAAFIYPLFGRPQHYCNHICPLGSAQQLMSEICGYKLHIPVKVLNALDWFRKILWAVLMLSLWTDCLTGWMDLELFQSFQYESASWWIIGTALLFVILSSVISRPYCRFVCPTGSLFKRSENIG